ncbi:MAG: isopentenyl-diphosphate Delta-isomerase [Calditrichaeota bacterium]|nr:MAG: isopentenyl-diphosphate Delta-isomerase [Calditrichota bacterium]MBL1206855.1 isopentenyl-diphosphate Delta-isomerase [Calditrichota bacterium]NOG46682.1 isopentenyl-diphosphate Delta-isomerase [Calditrichota bacterium]
MTKNDKIVSFESERLILVDDDDNVLGFKSKAECHNGEGILHRAFSIFIFNSQGQVIMQKRAKEKRLWPLIWSNSCCSHPREGESYEYATERRLKEELGLQTELDYLYKFRYHAKWKDEGSESELCSVYIGKSDDLPQVNETEIDEWKFFSREELNAELDNNPELYSPWFKMEWKEIQDNFWDRVEAL